MERYIGMDVHAASCTLAVISEKGRNLKDFPVETNGQALVEAVRMIPGRKHLVFEEGLQSAWLYEILSPYVGEFVVYQNEPPHLANVLRLRLEGVDYARQQQIIEELDAAYGFRAIGIDANHQNPTIGVRKGDKGFCHQHGIKFGQKVKS